jgi:ATP-dependent Clp protease adaptor protein ClpS
MSPDARPALSAVGLPEVETTTRVDVDTVSITVPRYHVVLHDDDDHSYEYVIEMLTRLFGHSPEKAFRMASSVDAQGEVVVDTTVRERAELKRDQIHSYGADPRIPHCIGSMSASIDRAD